MSTITKSQLIEEVITVMSICLWIYAAVSKLADFETFQRQMSKQVFGFGFENLLTWMLPTIELFAVALLIFSNTRFLGFLLSFSLMAVFTAYIILVISGFFPRIPCTCGGILGNMGWHQHLYFNLFFLLLFGIGARLSWPELRLSLEKGGKEKL